MTIELTPELEDYVEQKVASGSYTSLTAVIDAGVRLLKESDSNYALTPNGRGQKAHDTMSAVDYKARSDESEDNIGKWPPNFIKETYGSCADDPIELFPQGDFPDWEQVV